MRAMRIYILALIVFSILSIVWFALTFYASAMVAGDLSFDALHHILTVDQTVMAFNNFSSMVRDVVVPAVLLEILWLIAGIAFFRRLRQPMPRDNEPSGTP